ncbi:MAG: regulatory protein RecX [Candidatus Ventricola sp.]
MITVSSVRRNHGKAVLTLSSGEAVTMPRAMLRERPYRSGAPFDRAAFDVFLHERAYPFALEKAAALLSLRARTEKEIVDALRQNAYPEEAIARVMAELTRAGYLSDEAFARQWASSRTAKGMGAQRIRMELRRKGVSREQIDQALSGVDEDETFRSARLAAEKAARGRDLTRAEDREKALAALARRGFDYALARRALNALISSEP